jgi:CheY-like chemotaxis protein
MMGMILEIRAESGFLHVDATGKFSLEEAERTFLEILEAVAQHKVKKVLFDGRRITGNPKTMERFFYGKFAADAVRKFEDRGVSYWTQFAYVLEEPVLDPLRFGETVAVNRGMNVKTFDNLEDALQWLGIAPANNRRRDAGGKAEILLPQAANTPVVYIVDKEKSGRKSLSLLMQSAGLLSQLFSSVEEFLAKADAEANGCILLDIAMLPTDLQLQVELKRQRICLPLIAVSTQDDAKSRQLAMQLGARFFFRKPVDDQALLDTIHWVLTLKRHN